jgi:hypothetical protein
VRGIVAEIILRPVRLARDAFTVTYQGSRQDLAIVTAWRVQAGLLFLWLTARCVHLVQAGIDLTTGRGAYTHPGVAEALAFACLAESAAIAAVMIRAQRLTLSALLGDAAFGIAGLAVMSVAISGSPARAGSLNWMLPYTVATATGLGLLLAGEGGRTRRPSAAPVGAAQRQRWLLMPAQAVTVAALAAAYMLSVSFPRRLPADQPVQLWANDANYAGFFLVATVVAVLLRRRLALISQRNAEAARQAEELSEAAHWRALTAGVFGPVLELLDKLAVIGDVVPDSARAEAGRLIRLIEEVKPVARGGGSPS